MYYIYLWVLDFFIGASCVFYATEFIFLERDFYLDEKNIIGVVSVSATTDLMSCTMKCYKTETCELLTFNEQTQECIGYSEFTTGNVTEQGMMRHAYHMVQFLGGCNVTIVIHPEKATYSDASRACELNNGRLLVLDTKERHDCLLNITRPFPAFWVGLNDLTTEGDWLWISGMPYVKYSDGIMHAFNNKDNKAIGLQQTNADCGLLYPYSKTDGYFIGDYGCDTRWGFICERDYP